MLVAASTPTGLPGLRAEDHRRSSKLVEDATLRIEQREQAFGSVSWLADLAPAAEWAKDGA